MVGELVSSRTITIKFGCFEQKAIPQN